MSCYHPLLRVTNGSINMDTGKEIGTVIPYIPVHDRVPGTTYTEIPCGQCIGCRLDYSKRWADRLIMESRNHEHTWFITLTYDDDHLPISDSGFPTLVKRDIQLFMKNLRRAIAPERCRFYCSGEYGDHTFRPHYHMILFGVDLQDLTFYKSSKLGDIYYNSALIDKAWENKGFCVVAPASYESMAYTARYVTKKLKGFESSFYDQYGICPPFSLSSRKPGIAGNVFDKDTMRFDKIPLPEGRSAPHPRYFQKLFERDYPDEYEIYKELRKFRNDNRKQQLLDSIEIPYLDYLKVCEDNLKSRIKSLDEGKSF